MSLFEKLLEAQKAVSGVAKSGRNEAQKYDFVRAVDVVKEGKRVLNDVGLTVHLSVLTQESQVLPRGDKAPIILYTVTGHLALIDPEDNQQLVTPVVGAGSSYGDEKGVYKAITGAWKYGIRALLQIPDEKDDPEVETENDREVAPAQPAKPAMATQGQLKMLRARGHDLGLDDAGFKAFVFAAVGKGSSKELTGRDVETVLAKFEDKDFVEFYAGAKEVPA